MKYLIILALSAFGLQSAKSQTMTWVPSKNVKAGCKDVSNSKENILCYKLKYVPEKSGVLTSYTTGFWADCSNGNSSLVLNQSCSMSDKSQHVSACEQLDKILINCSGNSGTKASNFVKKGVAVYLHQICFQIESKQKVEIKEDILFDLTTSIDVDMEGPMTFFPNYKTFSFKNDLPQDQANAENIVLTLDRNQSKSTLRWTPAVEAETGTYVIERSSDNLNFYPIFKMEAALTADQQEQFLYEDSDKVKGEFYYRVTYQNVSNLNAISNIVHLQIGDGVDIELFPNPAFDYVNVKINSNDEYIIYKIYDSAGLLRTNAKIKSDEFHKIDVTKLGPGVYSINIETSEKSISRKFIVLGL